MYELRNIEKTNSLGSSTMNRDRDHGRDHYRDRDGGRENRNFNRRNDFDDRRNDSRRENDIPVSNLPPRENAIKAGSVNREKALIFSFC
jgi:hypothetical protein